MLISRSFLSKVKGTFPFVIFGNVAHFTTIVLVSLHLNHGDNDSPLFNYIFHIETKT